MCQTKGRTCKHIGDRNLVSIYSAIALSFKGICSISIIMDTKYTKIMSVTKDLENNIGCIFRVLFYFLLIVTPFSNLTTSLPHLLPSIAKTPNTDLPNLNTNT